MPKEGTETYQDRQTGEMRTRRTGYDEAGVSASMAQDENRRKLQALAARRGRATAVKKKFDEDDLKGAGKPKPEKSTTEDRGPARR